MIFRISSRPQEPAVPSAPSAQFRKGAPLFENSIGLKGFSLCLRPFRNWALGQSKGAGAWGRDEIRNAEGHFAVLPAPGSTGYGFYGDGLWGKDASRKTVVASTDSVVSGNYLLPKFAFSNAVPTGPQNVPPHIWQPIILYLGRRGKGSPAARYAGARS